MNPPTQPKAGKKVRARRMYVPESFFPVPSIAVTILREAGVSKRHTVPVFVLPADEASVEAMELTAAKALHDRDERLAGDGYQYISWSKLADRWKRVYLNKARTVLRSLSIHAKGEV